MAAISMTAEPASMSRALRTLALAWLGLFALLILLGVAVFVFGKAPQAVVSFTIPEKKKPHATAAAANPAAPVAPPGQPAAPNAPPGTPPAPIPVPPPAAVPGGALGAAGW